MIRSRLENGQIGIHVTCERLPRIYFDQFALHHFSTKSNDRQRFFDAFATKGELLFSSINVIEVNALQGRSADLVRTFLTEIGPHWVPIEFDALKVTKDLVTWSKEPAAPYPALGGGLLWEIYQASPGSIDQVSLAAAVDMYRTDDPGEHLAIVDGIKRVMVQGAAHARSWYVEDPSRLDAIVPIITSLGPVAEILSRLLRVVILELRSHQWEPNDAYDFVHAVVPLACSDVIFLDKKWKRRVLSLPERLRPKHVFYGAETEAFLRYFEAL